MTTDSTEGNEQAEMPGVAGATEDGRVYVVTPQAMAVEGPPREDADKEQTRSEIGDRSGRRAGKGRESAT
jgi:hypothetical protein